MLFSINLNRKTENMGLTKPNDYTTEQIVFSQIGKALGHPARQRILMILKEESMIRATDLSNALNLNVATIHKHLLFLEHARLITADYRIHESLLKIDPRGLRKLEEMTSFLTENF
jgi:DNA-binding transcriptional ArsR family regulator